MSCQKFNGGRIAAVGDEIAARACHPRWPPAGGRMGACYWAMSRTGSSTEFTKRSNPLPVRKRQYSRFHIVLLHLGFIVVGLPYSFKGQLGIKELLGATPYGATTIVPLHGKARGVPVRL